MVSTLSIALHESGRLKSEYAEKEHDALRSQIEELKVALEHAHMERKRKVEYDTIAEKINTLPSREELEQWVMSKLLWCLSH